jgi:predicted small secreted protein
MAEYVSYQNPQTVAADQNVLLIDTIPCNKGYVIHRNGSGILTLRAPNNGCARFARYQVTFNGNIAIPEGGTVGAIATALAIDGEELQSSRAIVTPAAPEQYFNVTNTAIVTVLAGCCTTLAVENVNAGVGEDIDQQAISVADGNLTVQRIA